MTTTPPGWYDDGHGALRWWDGAQWTEHVAEPDPEPTAGAPTEDDIVAASEAGAVPGAVAAETDPANAASFGVPSPAGTPDYQSYAAAGQAQTAPPAYAGAQGDFATIGLPPAGYPADAPGGAFSAASEPAKSKLWILWVVLGVVLLGIVIAAAVVIPLLFLNLATSGGATGGTDDEKAAVAAVELYDDAWQNADCDAYTDSTTDQFRASSGLTECESFTAEAEAFGESVDEYEVTVDEIISGDDEITVTTTETYVSLLDEEGNPAESPEPGSIVYQYTVIPVDGGWVIDSIASE